MYEIPDDDEEFTLTLGLFPLFSGGWCFMRWLGGGGSRVHDVLLRVALRTVKAVRPSLVSSDPSATESELAFLFLLFFASTAVLSVLAIHHMAKDWDLWHQLALQFEVLTTSVPSIEGAVVASPGDLSDDVGDEKKNVVNDKSLVDPANPTQLRCHDPSTSAFLGTVPNMSSSDVDALCLRAKLAHRNEPSPSAASSCEASKSTLLPTPRTFAAPRLLTRARPRWTPCWARS